MSLDFVSQTIDRLKYGQRLLDSLKDYPWIELKAEHKVVETLIDNNAVVGCKVRQKDGKKISLAHFNYINPLPKNTGEIFSRFKKLVVAELNAGQFVNYLRMNFSLLSFEQINKIQGLPFTIAEIKEKCNSILEDK